MKNTMKNSGRGAASRGLFLIFVLALTANIPIAGAATGDILRQFIPTGPTGNGRGMAFDGMNNLYYTIVGDTNIYKTNMFGVLNVAIPTPTVNGIQPQGGPLTWDGSSLWTINYGTNGDMVQLTPGGTLISTCNIFTANSGHPALTPHSKIDHEDGLDWTGIPGSELVLSGEDFPGNSVVFMNTNCVITSWFTAPTTNNHGTSGVAFDGVNFWHSNAHTLQFQTNLAGALTGISFNNNIRLEDLAYDPVTFAPKCALWSNEGTLGTNHITAYEVPCGVSPNGSIAGTKFNDLNGNGMRDSGEPGLPSWQIDLNDTSGNVLQTTTTAADGSYKFQNVSPGTYIVQERLKPGWIQTAPAPVPPGTYTVTITAGQNVTSIDFGNEQCSGECKVVGWGNLGSIGNFQIWVYSHFLPSGTMEFTDTIHGVFIKATRIDTIVTNIAMTPKKGTIIGKADVTENGAFKGNLNFQVDVTDKQDPSNGQDTFTISVLDYKPAFMLSGYSVSGAVTFGDIKVVK